jgi:hypothetical protein
VILSEVTVKDKNFKVSTPENPNMYPYEVCTLQDIVGEIKDIAAKRKRLAINPQCLPLSMSQSGSTKDS